jgi:hypothetical protein
MAKQVEHWFNRRWGVARRDVHLLRTETGWQVRGRQGGNDSREVVYYFDHEQDARAMVNALMQKVPPELANWAQVTERQPPADHAIRG